MTAKTSLSTPYNKAEDSPGFLLWQLTNKWQMQQRAALKAFDLTHVQFVLLATLTYSAGKTPITQKQLADYAQTDVMMTSQVIRKLVAKKLIQREPSGTDGRAFSLTPTPAGITLVNQAIKKVEEVDHHFFHVLNQKDTQSLVRMMQKLIKVVP